MTITVTTPPALEPLKLSEAKLHLAELANDNDALINSLILVAREYCENETGLALINRGLKLTLDDFKSCIEIPKPPLVSVETVEYVDTDGVTQLLADTLYRIDAESSPGRLTPAYGESWPSVRPVTNAVSIKYTAGYGADRSAVPMPIKQAMLLLIGHYYQNREITVTGLTLTALPMAVDALLNQYRIYNV